MAPPPSTPPDDLRELRRQAEAKTAERKELEGEPPPEELRGLVHELRVHQIELEMQNEALRTAQLELEISRDRYADLYDSAPIGFLTFSEEGTIEEINLTGCRMLQGNRSQLIGQKAVSHVAHADKNRFLMHLRLCREALPGSELFVEATLHSGYGELPVEIRTTPNLAPQTGDRRYLAAILDLTELRRSEKATKEADHRLAELLESITDAFVSLDAQWRFTYVNDRACCLLQKPRSDLIGSVLWDAFPEADESVARSSLHRVMRNRIPAEFEIYCEVQDKWLDFRCYPSVSGVTAYFLDITGQKRSAERLYESERRLKLALEAGEMGLWSWIVLTNESIWNDREFELLGLPPREGTVDTATLFERVHPEDRAQLKAQVDSVLKHGSIFRHEFRVVWDNGEIRWLRSLGRLTRDDQGRPLVMTGVNFDITEAKRAKLELEAVNRNLEHEVAERTSELQMLRDIASAANRSQSVEEALLFALQRVTEHNGWSFAHSFLPSDGDPDVLVPAYDFFPADAEVFEDFRRLTCQTVFRRGSGLPGRVYETGQPEWSTDLHTDLGPERAGCAEQLGITTVAAFPIMAEDRAVGVFEFFSEIPVEPAERMLQAMASVGTLLGRVIERKTFQSRLLTIADDQQRHLGQQLHDDIGQELTGLALKAETLTENLADDGSRWSDFAAQLVGGLNRVQQKTRALSHGLIPMDIEAAILEAALEDLAEQATVPGSISCSFYRSGEGRISDNRIATQLFRIAQEALANALAHADASYIDIELSFPADEVLLTVRDDGKGLSGDSNRSDGMGLRIMYQRAALIGAVLTIETSHSGGTEVACRVPRKRF